MENSNKIKYYIALLAAVFIWSSAFVVTKAALVGLGPIMLSTTRIFIAFIILLPFALKRGFRFNSLFSKNSFIYGIFGYGGNLVLISIGMLNCSANISAIIHGLFPVFMVILGYVVLNEGVTRSKIIGIALSVIGVFIASIGDLVNNSGTTIPGMILVVLSVLTWAYYSVYSKKTAEGMDSFVLTEICFGASLLCTLPFAIGETIWLGISVPDAGTLASLLYLGIFSGAAGILLWNYGLKQIDSGIAGVYFNLMPVIGLFFAFVVGENISVLQITGGVFVFAGVLVSQNLSASSVKILWKSKL